MNWNAYFESAGVNEQPDFTVWQPSAVSVVSALVKTESTDVWKDYLRFHLVEHYAGVLPKAIAAEHSLSTGQSTQEQSQLRTANSLPSPQRMEHWARRSVNFTRNGVFRLKPRRKRKPWSAT
jgi:predicted metalloendopeptidase